MQDRKTLLEIILRYEDPGALPELRRDLATYGYDCEEDLVTLTSATIVAVLERYLQGELTAKEVFEWVEFMEQREDIEFGRENEDDIGVQEIIFKIGTPELEGPLTVQRAEALIKVLNTKKSPSAEDIGLAYARS